MGTKEVMAAPEERAGKGRQLQGWVEAGGPLFLPGQLESRSRDRRSDVNDGLKLFMVAGVE